MFDVENGRYRILEEKKEDPLQYVSAELTIPSPRRCLKQKKAECRTAAVYSQEHKERHILYGLYDRAARKPTEFHIYRERYQCQACGSTFFADDMDADFQKEEHALPEFIKYLVKEWVQNKHSSFQSIGEKYSYSKATISDWCGQLVKAFDSKTKCNTRKQMYFSSFRYGKKDPKVHCAIYTLIKKEPIICGIIEDYTDADHLEKKIRERLDRLSVAEEVFYDYYPGVNKAIQAAFPNARIQIWQDSFEEELHSMIAGLDKTYLSNMRTLVLGDLGSPYVTYQEWFVKFDKWINMLPEQNLNEVSEFYASLKKDTPQHIVNIWEGCPTEDFGGLTEELNQISGNIPYESFKLRLLYESPAFASMIENCLENLVIKNKPSNKKKAESALLAEILKYNLHPDKTDVETGEVICSFCKESIRLKGVKPIMNKSPYCTSPALSVGNSIDEIPANKAPRIQSPLQQDEGLESPVAYSINFFEAFQCLDPNEMFATMPPIRDWFVPIEYIYDVIEDEKENNEWKNLND